MDSNVRSEPAAVLAGSQATDREDLLCWIEKTTPVSPSSADAEVDGVTLLSSI